MQLHTQRLSESPGWEPATVMAGAGGQVGFVHDKATRQDQLQTLENCPLTVQNLQKNENRKLETFSNHNK